jgi:hypothetical protein
MKFPDSATVFRCLGTVAITVIGFTALATSSRAALVYDESVDAPGGDLSNVRTNPTFLAGISEGTNSLKFTLNNPLDSTGELRILRDLDYFYLTVPQGFVFSQLNLIQYDRTVGGTVTPGTDNIAFIALQSGTQFTEPAQPSECPTLGQTNCSPVPSVVSNPANLLGYTLIGTQEAANLFESVNEPGENLLPFMGATIRPNQPSNGPIIPSPIPNNGQGFIPPLASGNYVFWAQQTAPGKVTVQLDFVVSPIPEPSSPLAFLALVGVLFQWQRKNNPS